MINMVIALSNEFHDKLILILQGRADLTDVYALQYSGGFLVPEAAGVITV